MKQSVCIEMETGDIDDVLTLILMLKDKSLDIKCIVVTPGSPHQLGIIHQIVKEYGKKSIPLGSFNPKSTSVPDKSYAKIFNYRPYSAPLLPGHEMLREYSGHQTTLFTIGPFKASVKMMKNYPEVKFKQWITQGGFAGEGVMHPDKILEKFKGKRVCATCNFVGKDTFHLLNATNISNKYMISKNICHGYIYDEKMALDLDEDVNKIMALRYGEKVYEKKKAMHDILAYHFLITPDKFTMVEVEMYREKNCWGCNIKGGSACFISIDHEM